MFLVQQSSLYGLAGMLPRRYTQAVMSFVCLQADDLLPKYSVVVVVAGG